MSQPTFRKNMTSIFSKSINKQEWTRQQAELCSPDQLCPNSKIES
jgi:hypothetical protein